MGLKWVLSRHFDSNTELVALKCHSCYRDDSDCQITGINGEFLNSSVKSEKSPHNLIEEDYRSDPWKLLVATIFLNKTSCRKARPNLLRFFRDFPDAGKVATVSHPGDLRTYFVGIGLEKRAFQVWKMSNDYLFKNWSRVGELFGIGKYGEDAFRLIYLGDLSAEPDDRFLKIYKGWRLSKMTR